MDSKNRLKEVKDNKVKLKVYSVRADEELMRVANNLEIDTALLFRKALVAAIRETQGRCAQCGQSVKMKWEKV